MKRPATLAFLVVLVLSMLCASAASCVPKHRIIEGGANLGLGPPLIGVIDEGPFRLVFAGPKGDTTATTADGQPRRRHDNGDPRTPKEITLAFSRSVVLAKNDQPAAKIVRDHDGGAVDGSWRWFGESMAVFQPAKSLAFATVYRVEPIAGLQSRDTHASLDAASLTPFTFATERPKLESVDYQYDDKKDKHYVYAQFNQDISPLSLKDALKIEGRGPKGNSAVVAFKVVDNEDGKTDHARATLEADPAIGRLEDVTVTATKGLRSDEGPALPTSESAHFPLEGVGPFRVELSCTPVGGREMKTFKAPSNSNVIVCGRSSSIDLQLSKQVKTKDLIRNLIIAKPHKADAETLKNLLAQNETIATVDLTSLLSLDPGVQYRVTIKSALAATDKDRLTADQTFEFQTPDLPPQIGYRDLEGPETVVESGRSAISLRLTSTNIASFDAVSAPLDESQLIDVLFAHRDIAWVRGLPKSTSQTTPIVAPEKNNFSSSTINLGGDRAPNASGAYVLATYAKEIAAARAKKDDDDDGSIDRDDLKIFSVTDLGVTTKWSPYGALVWVTRLSNAEPVANATVSLRRVWTTKGKDKTPSSEAFRTTTDREGVALLPSQVVATFLRPSNANAAATPDDDGTATPLAEPLLIVKKENDWTYARPPELDPSLLPSVGDIFVDRGLYRPGETVSLKGYFRAPSPRGFVTQTLAGKSVYVEALDRDQHVFFATTATLDGFGSFATELPIPKTTRLGRSFVRARVGIAPPPRVPRAAGRYGYSRWRAEASWPALDHFTIDEFRTPELKVESKTDRASYIRGDKASLDVVGMYLLGAPVTNVPVTVNVTHSKTTFTPHGLEAFTTSTSSFPEAASAADSETAKAERRRDLEPVHLEAKLDASGHAIFSYPLPTSSSSTTFPDSYNFDVGITDISRTFAVGDDVRVIVHPSDTYLGIKTNHEDGPVIAGKTVRVDLVAALIDGTRRSGIKTRIDLVRSVPPTEKEKKAKEDASDKLVPIPPGCTLTTDENKVVSCTLNVANEGKHYLKATAVDASGRAIAAATYIHVEPKNTKPPPPPPPPEKPTPPAPSRATTFEEACAEPTPIATGTFITSFALNRKTDNVPFFVGENALVCLRSSAPKQKTRTLFTLEREGILRREPLFEIGSAGKLIKVPITPELHPSVSGSMIEAMGRTGTFPSESAARWGDGGDHPRTVNGGDRISVRAPAKTLKIAIEAPEKPVRPGSDVELRLHVDDGDGKPAPSQITVWAVDEGIQLLVPKGVPRPQEVFAEERTTDVTTTDTRTRIFYEHGNSHRAKAPSVRMGATSVNARDLVGRSVFRPTAFFLSNVLTDANGSATVRAKLPDNLTSWKVFAVAATTGDSFGSAEATFVANKPLMVRPQLPRFLRTGDRFDATIVIDSLVKEPLDVEVTMSATGVVSAKAPKQSLKIPAEGHVPVHFPLEARAVGNAKITFRVTTKDLGDEVTIDEDVQSIASLETVTLAGEIAKSPDPVIANERFGDLTKARADVGGFEVRLSTTPLVGLAESMNDLIDYPYGCTEQLSSRLVPLVRLRGMAHDLGVTLPANVDASVRSSLASLLSHQRDDGGFGFWQGSRKSEAWLTLLALDALVSADKHGFVVSSSTIDRARAWLEKTDTKPENDADATKKPPKEKLDAESRAMLEDLLASMGKARANELHVLANEPKLPLFAQALVAHALAKVNAPLAKQMLDRILAKAQRSGTIATFAEDSSLIARTHLSSNARTTAIVLRAMLAIDPKHPMIASTVRGLLSMRSQGRWQTTQASAWALGALEDARVLYAPSKGRTTAEIRFEGKAVAKTSFLGLPGGETRTASIPMSRLLAAPNAPLGFESDGERPLYYEGTLRYARTEPPTSPLEHGMSIARSIRPLPSRGGGDIRIGDYVVVDVVIASSLPRDLVVVDDPIPAGFEVVNQSFANTDRFIPVVSDPARDLTHRELRDDRVVSFFDAMPAGAQLTRYALRAIATGHFALPPAKAECMYSPDVFGRTATTWIDVH